MAKESPMLKRALRSALFLLILATNLTAQAAPTKSIWDGVYSEAQAKRGSEAYRAACSGCHGGDLSGFNGVLIGTTFMNRWREDNLSSLFTNIKTTMPRNNPGTLKADMYLDIVTYILQQNSFPSGESELREDDLKSIQVVGKGGADALPAGALAQIFGCITAGSDNAWLLTSATAPVRTRNPEKSSDEDLKSAQTIPAGSQTLRLVDSAFYHPERHKDERVEAKGFLMKDPADGLSLTSLTTISGTCQ